MSEMIGAGSAFGERNEQDTFAYLFGIACARLEEALRLQGNPRYRHAWLDSYPNRSQQIAGFRLAFNLDEYMIGQGEVMDVGIPIKPESAEYDVDGLLIGVDVLDDQEAFFVVTNKTLGENQTSRVISPQSIAAAKRAGGSNDDLDSKLFAYDIVPFRLQQQSA